MSKVLVAYFSATKVTEKVARRLAVVAGADLHEIKPLKPYTSEDLDWLNKESRSSIEMNNKAMRPAVANKVENMDEYDTIYLGFPIWWYVAPTIINTFLEQYNMTGKKIIPFATSGSSGMGTTNAELADSCKGAVLKEGRRFSKGVTEEELKSWIDSFEEEN